MTLITGQQEHPHIQQANRYTYRVEWSVEDDCYLAKVDEFPSLVADGDNPMSALRELLDVVIVCVADMTAGGEALPTPKHGK